MAGIRKKLAENRIIKLHFAHANGFPAGSYQQVFQALEPHFHVLALKQFGHNPLFPVNKNLSNLVSELIDYLDRNTSEPIYAVGHSMGALVSYMAACQAPHKFKGVLMLDPPIASGLASWLFKLAKGSPLINRISPAGKAAVRRQSWPIETDLLTYFSSKSLFKNFKYECIEDYVQAGTQIREGRQILTFKAEVEAQIFRNVCDNIHQFYGKMHLPSCLVTAELSQVCIPRYISHFINHTQIEHIQVPAVGHMFPLEKPEEIAQLIMQKLTQWDTQYKKG